LNYLVEYIRRPDLSPICPARAVAIERHYIDRDYMEDHSVFYSRNLASTPNFCRRVHFFAGSANESQGQLERIAQAAYRVNRDNSNSMAEHTSLCNAFSERYYLGFAVIRPLSGSPVGR